jgi:hypothetical protein
MTIRTNNVPRHIVESWELTEKEKSEFDYIEFNEDCCSQFFRYKGQVYDINEFVRIEEYAKRSNPWTYTTDDRELLKWQGIQTASYFSAVVIRYTSDNESVIVGTYTC